MAKQHKVMDPHMEMKKLMKSPTPLNTASVVMRTERMSVFTQANDRYTAVNYQGGGGTGFSM